MKPYQVSPVGRPKPTAVTAFLREASIDTSGAPSIRPNALRTPLSSTMVVLILRPISAAFCSAAAISARASSAVMEARE